MGGISIWQLLIVVVIVVLLFRTKKLSSLELDLGTSIKGFKKAIGDNDKPEKSAPDADFTAKTIANKQDDAKEDETKRHDKEQVQLVFDVGFNELLLVFVTGLIVLGPQRLPIAVKMVADWVRTLCSLAATVRSELAQELKLQEFQGSPKKVGKASLNNLTPELKASMDELRETAEPMKRSYSAYDPEKTSDEADTILSPVVKGDETQRQDVTPAMAEHQASAPVHAPGPVADKQPASPAELPAKKVSTTAATPHSPLTSSGKP